jgi:hypothetical protein
MRRHTVRVRVQEQIKPIREQLHLTETTTFESIRRHGRAGGYPPTECYTPIRHGILSRRLSA